MLETQIDNLTNHVAALEHKLDHSNTLLQAILTLLQGQMPPPAIAGQQAKNDDCTEIPPPVTLAHIRDAFQACAAHYDTGTARLIIQQIVGDIPNIKHIPEDKFATVFNALSAHNHQGAA